MTSQERAAELVQAEQGYLLTIGGIRPGDGEKEIARVRTVIASAIDAAVAEALAVGGVPGVQLTAEQVQEIKELHAKTTQGKWMHRKGGSRGGPPAAAVVLVDDAPGTYICAHGVLRLRDAEFIATSHQCIPALLSDRACLMSVIRDMHSDALIDPYTAGYRKGHADASGGCRI